MSLSPPRCRTSLLLHSGCQAPRVTVQTRSCHWCDSQFILQALRCEADAAGRWGISCWNLLSFIFPLGNSSPARTEQGGGDRSKRSEEDEGGRKAVCRLAPGPALQAALLPTLPGDGEVGGLDERAGRAQRSGKLRAENPVTNTL